jgi:hypothetical protein
MAKEEKKNKACSGRARNQRRDPLSGRFAKDSTVSGTTTGIEGVPPREAAADVENMVPDVPPGFEMINPNGATRAVDIVPDVPPGFEMVTPKGTAGFSSSSAIHEVQLKAFSSSSYCSITLTIKFSFSCA